MLSFLYTLFAFLVAITVLVVIHEFGHFWVARRLGVKVLRFSVGFGKTLFRYQTKSGTEFVIAAIPLGGYIKMLDEAEGPVADEELPYAFNRKPLLSRTAVVLAGPLFNLLFAIVAYWLMFVIGVTSIAPVIGKIAPHSIAAEAGLQSQQKIISIDGNKTPSWHAVNLALLKQLGSNKILNLQTQPIDDPIDDRPSPTNHQLNLQRWTLDPNNPRPLRALGIHPFQPSAPAVIAKVVMRTPAATAGLQAGDKIITVDGRPINNFSEFVEMIQASPNKPVTLGITRNSQTKKIVVIPKAKKNASGQLVGFLGVQSAVIKWPDSLINKQQYSLLGAVWPALQRTWHIMTLSMITLGKIITGHVSFRLLSGPIGIAQGAGISASIGLAYYLSFLALISINLGIINLLPIPVLDGGHLLYYVAEFIRKKPLSQRMQEMGYRIGLTLLLGVVAIAIFNDVLRLW